MKSQQQQRERHVYGPYCVVDKSGATRHAYHKYNSIDKEQSSSTNLTSKARFAQALRRHEDSKDGISGQPVDYRNLFKWEQRDSAMLDMLHSLLGDAPQLVLQIYILIRRPPTEDQTDLTETGISI